MAIAAYLGGGDKLDKSITEFSARYAEVIGGDRVFGTHTAAPTGGRGQSDAPTLPPPDRPGLDLTTVNPPCSRT